MTIWNKDMEPILLNIWWFLFYCLLLKTSLQLRFQKKYTEDVRWSVWEMMNLNRYDITCITDFTEII